MNKILGLLVLLSLFAYAQNDWPPSTRVHRAVYDAATDSISTTLEFVGGCSQRDFALEFGQCKRAADGSTKVFAKLVELTHEIETCGQRVMSPMRLSLAQMPCRQTATLLKIVSKDRSVVDVLVPTKKR